MREKLGNGRKMGGDGITLKELGNGHWEARWWRGGKWVRRRAPSLALAEKLAERERKKREVEAKANVRERKLEQRAAKRGDHIVGLLNMDLEHRQALMLAVAKMKAAGRSPMDLPEAADEWIAAHLSAGAVPLGEAVARHVKELQEAERSKRTVGEREWRLGSLVEALGAERGVAGIRRGEVAEWIQDTTPGSRPHRHRAASAFFRWAWARGMVQENPLAGVPAPPRTPPEPVVLKPSEVRKVLETARKLEPGMLLYFAVGFFAGLRPEKELAWLVWEDIDLAERKIWVPWGRAKTRRTRGIPISENLAAWLETVPERERKGRVHSGGREAIRRVVRGSGVKWQEDVMRHTRVSYRLAETGGNVAMVALEGGHSPAILARHYAEQRISKKDVAAFWGIFP